MQLNCNLHPIHSLWVQRVVCDVVPVPVGPHLLRAMVMSATTHVHLVLVAQVVEIGSCISTATPFSSGPRLGELELETGEECRWFCSAIRVILIRCCCCTVRCIRRGVRVTAHCPCPAIHEFALGHEFAHLLERDFERTIDPAELFQQLSAFLVVAGGEVGWKGGQLLLWTLF